MPYLTAYNIKLIAITAMLIDHIAWSFVDLENMTGQIMHLFGRITAPIMCFFIVQGFIHTKSLIRYLHRLIIFAVISQLPYSYFRFGTIALLPFNMIYTLALGLLVIYSFCYIHNEFWRIAAILIIIAFSLLGDWMYLAIAFCLVFYIYCHSFTKQAFAIAAIAVLEVIGLFFNELALGKDIISAWLNSGFQLGILLSLPLIYLYNGNQGGFKYSRWLFYIFYPAHLLILGIIKALV